MTWPRFDSLISLLPPLPQPSAAPSYFCSFKLLSKQITGGKLRSAIGWQWHSLNIKDPIFPFVFVEPANNLDVWRRKPVIQADDKCEMILCNTFSFGQWIAFPQAVQASLGNSWSFKTALILLRIISLVSSLPPVCCAAVMYCAHQWFPSVFVFLWCMKMHNNTPKVTKITTSFDKKWWV